jgi:hypothetical protein
MIINGLKFTLFDQMEYYLPDRNEVVIDEML